MTTGDYDYWREMGCSRRRSLIKAINRAACLAQDALDAVRRLQTIPTEIRCARCGMTETFPVPKDTPPEKFLWKVRCGYCGAFIIAPPVPEAQTYTHDICCMNCHHPHRFEVPRGTSVHDFAKDNIWGKAICRNCGLLIIPAEEK